MKKSWFILALSAAVLAQAQIEVSVESFDFGKKAPMTQVPELELWHIPGDVYTKNGTGYFSDYCWSADGRYISYSESRKGASVLDFHEMKSIQLPRGSLPFWMRNQNAAVFLADSVLQMLDLDSMEQIVINTEVDKDGRMGNVDCNDEYVYVWATEEGVIRYPLKANARAEHCNITGNKVNANPFYPAVAIKQTKVDKALGPGGSWMNLDGRVQKTMVPAIMRHHSNWLGDGEYFVLGDGPVRGRKWDEPYPSNLHLLSPVDMGDFGSLGASGRWAVGGGNGGRAPIRAADLRSGDLLFEFWPFSAVALPKGSGDKSGYYDSEPKGSPDGTKFVFGSTCDLTEIPYAFATAEQSGTSVKVSSTDGFPASGHFAYSNPHVNGCAVAAYTSKTKTSFNGVKNGAFGTANGSLTEGAWITPWEPRLLPEDGFEPSPKSHLGSYAKNEKMAGTPLQYQKNLQCYIAVVRKPDAPVLRKRDAGIQLIPGENHRETYGYFFFKDGKKINDEPVLPGETFAVTKAGVYAVSAVEWFGLESAPSEPVTLSKPQDIQVLENKPADFSWTAFRWVVAGKEVDETTARSAAQAIRETVHLRDGVIAKAGFKRGDMESLFDLNTDGQVIRRCFYKGGKRVRRDYTTRDGKLDARELFDADGYITEQMIHFHGGSTPDMHWFYEKGVPQKLVTQVFSARCAREGAGTYEKQGLDWVKQ